MKPSKISLDSTVVHSSNARMYNTMIIIVRIDQTILMALLQVFFFLAVRKLW